MARQNFIGLVVSQGKMQKTVKVRVQTKAYDKKIHKEVLKRKDYLVHDEGNLCKEGDIVRIEAIPKISARKYFAIAEIKVNKGQQFALYDQLAKEKVLQEEASFLSEFSDRRAKVESIITQVEDLKRMDIIAHQYQRDAGADRSQLLAEIEAIKQKYNIKSWPTVEPVLDLDINEAARDLSVAENRLAHIKPILNKLMADEYEPTRTQILAQISKKDASELKPNVQKNLLRKYVLDPKNDCPVQL